MLQASPVALIADAGSSFGAAYAERLARRGFDLMLVDASAARLRRVVTGLRGASNRRVQPVLADLGDVAEQRGVAELLRAHPDVRLLVNNLAAGDPTPLLTADPDRTARAIALNVAAAARLAQAAAAAFAERGEGRIVNVAPAQSADRHGDGVQAAARAFMLTLSSSLRHELADTGVAVRVLTWAATAQRHHHPGPPDYACAAA